MKFIINKSDIKNILAKVQGVAGRRTNLAITETVLITATDEGIRMMATDLETGFEGSYSAAVESTGAIAINAKKLFEIVKDFPREDVHVHEVENRWIKIGNDKIEYHIVGMNPEDYPDSPKLSDASFFEMDSQALRKMIEKSVIITGANDDRRSHINGVFFEKIEKEEGSFVLRMVSTDGSRLSTVDDPCDDEPPFAAEVLIPKKGLVEVLKFLDSEGSVQVGLQESHFIVKKQSETVTIRLLEGDFPKYTDIVKNRGTDILLDRKQFLGMLRRMSILSSDSYKGVVFNFAQNRLLVTASNPDIGESREEMPVDYDGEAIEAAFNPRFFIDALGAVEENMVRISIINAERPCMVEGEDDKSYLCVVMPMRI
ncbi:MAG: DNA polymerase III subunit beta [Desulfobacterales bacterium]